MRYLLDTDICIYLIKHHPPEVLAQFQKHSPGDVAVSAVTLFELQYGAQKSRSFRQAENALSKFLLPLSIIELDRFGAEEAAAIRAHLKKKGERIGPYDLLIAGIARSRKMTLVTNNTKEFGKVDNLHLENWVQT